VNRANSSEIRIRKKVSKYRVAIVIREENYFWFMQKGMQIVLSVLCVTLLFLNVVSQVTPIEGSDWILINIDGDVSSSAFEDRKFWNPHVYGFSPEMEWNISFDETVSITLQTSGGEGGHVATGMWWTSGFEEGIKIPLNNLGIQVEFDVKVSKFTYETSGDWLRIALACAVQRANGEVVYTELDFLDSPGTLQHEKGNILLGGDIIYQFGDVVEFRIDEIPLQEWRHFQIDLTSYIERAWKIRDGDRLESIYIVVESEGVPVEVMLEVDNLWIMSSVKS